MWNWWRVYKVLLRTLRIKVPCLFFRCIKQKALVALFVRSSLFLIFSALRCNATETLVQPDRFWSCLGVQPVKRRPDCHLNKRAENKISSGCDYQCLMQPEEETIEWIFLPPALMQDRCTQVRRRHFSLWDARCDSVCRWAAIKRRHSLIHGNFFCQQRTWHFN